MERMHRQVQQAGLREPTPPREVRRSPQLKSDNVDRLVAGRLAGAEISSLATEFGVHRATVIAHLNRRGIEGRRRQPRSLSPSKLQRAGEYYAAGNSLIETGERFNVDRRWLRKALPAAGFTLRPPGRQRRG